MKGKESNFKRGRVGTALLAAAMALMLVPGTGVTVHAVDAGETGGDTVEIEKDYSRSITTTNLDQNYEAEVTISLPSKEEQLATEVCFVLDKSSFSNTTEPAMQLLKELKTDVDKSGAKVQVDIVEFNRTGHDHGSYDLSTQFEDIRNAFVEQNPGGTNMHAGLLLASEVLARNTSIPDSRKYMILVSDGDSYLYCKGNDYNTPYSRSFIPVDKARGYGGYYDESWYNPSAGYEDKDTGKTNVKRPTTSSSAEWEAYLNDVAARNQESNGDSYDFVWKYYDGWQEMTPDRVAANGFITQPSVPRSASNLDMAFYNVASTYHELAGKYHCFATAAASWNTADGGHRAFMDYLNNGAATGFENIKNEILYMLGAGTTVTENIGYVKDVYDFDLIDPEKMTIRIDGSDGSTVNTYPAVKIEDNHYGFGDLIENANGQKTYPYEVVYTPGEKKDDEKFVWTINVPVTNFQRLNLVYKVKLMNPKTVPGTYGEYDADGSQGKESLFVSNSAILSPVDSAGTSYSALKFAKPTVSYTVAGPTPSATATPGSYDDGGPFTRDACGNVFDRWGNQIWTSPTCGLKSVPKTGSGK